MLNFLGTGSAFNTEKGNTSAFIKKDNSLLLIDCGGTVFHRLQELNLLDGVENLYIVVTHGDKTKNRTFAPASGAGENIVSHTRHSNKSSSVITIPQILSSVNSNFEGFVKYFPDELLSVNQQLQKKKDIADEAAYIERKRQEEWKKKEGLYNKAVADGKNGHP